MSVYGWIKAHEASFGSPFEKAFVINVLAKVNNLDLEMVSVQYCFKDLDGKIRYCDFVIQEGSIRIAIEIDGYDKRSTGQGMSHDDFVDWQRRQAALTACGWHVLRFANRDVSNEPERCRRYIELLLRDQRSKSQHQASLEEAIGDLSYQLKAAQGQAGTADQTGKLHREMNLLKNQLVLAQSTKPLNPSDRGELRGLVARLEQEKQELVAARDKIKEKSDRLESFNAQLQTQKQVMDGENATMKVTIWAFTTIIGIIVAAGVYLFTVPGVGNGTAYKVQEQMPQMVPQVTQRVSGQTPSTFAPSCDSPIDWRLAKNHVGQRIAVRGIVADYRHLPNGKGSPTWINIGAKYPVHDRLSVVVWGGDRSKFGRALSDGLVNRKICIVGTIKLHNGTPQIALQWPRDLVFQ